MARKRIYEIEKEENRKSAEMVLRIVGDRSYKDTAEAAGLDASTVSYICRGKVKPSPEVCIALTKPEANPQGGVTRDELMIACGYQSNMVERITAYADFLNEKKETEPKDEDRDVARGISIAERKFRNKAQIVGNIFVNALIEAGYGIKAKKQIEVGESVNLQPDLAFVLPENEQQIEEWLLILDLYNFHMVAHSYIMSEVGRILFLDGDRTKTKYSIVVDSMQKYELFKRWEGKIPYRGELSVILMDNLAGVVEGEFYLAHYVEGDTSKEILLK